MYIVSENIFVCNLLVTCGGIFLWIVVIFTERCGWFVISWLFMSVQIKYSNNARYFYRWHAAGFLYNVLLFLRKDEGDLQQLCIHFSTNKITVFLRLIDAVVCSKFLHIGYLCRFDKSHFIHHVIFASSFFLCLLLIWLGPWNLLIQRIL